MGVAVLGFLGGLLGVLLMGVLRGVLRLVFSRTGRWVLAVLTLWILWRVGAREVVSSLLVLALVCWGLWMMVSSPFRRARRRER